MKTNNSYFSRILVILIAVMMVFTMMPSMAFADVKGSAETSINVYVNISQYGEIIKDKDNEPIAMRKLSLTGKSGYTISDVLTKAHDEFHQGGANAGYATASGTYGTYITKFWGDESGNVGYQVNGGKVNVQSLDQTIEDGDIIDAYIYQNSYPDSESYVTFDKMQATVGTGETLKLTLSEQKFNENFTPYMTPYTLGEVYLTKDGTTTDIAANDSGKFEISFENAGTYVVSAKKQKQVNEQNVTAITAPVCVVTVVAPITVRVSAQKGTEYTYLPENVTVPYGIAKKYGFENGSNLANGTITALDALVAAHAQCYGEKFSPETAKNYLKMGESGSPTESFKDSASGIYSGFAVNHNYYMDSNKNGYLANTAPLKDGDLVDFFYYEDLAWKDMLTWFERADGQKSDEITVEVGENAELYLKGFEYSNGYNDNSGTAIYNEEGALSVYTIPAGGDITSGEEVATVKNENGKVAFSFEKLGEYGIAAMGYDANDRRVIMPYCKVNVVEKGKLEDNKASDIAISGVTYTFNKDKFDYELPDQKAATTNLRFTVTAAEAKSITAANNGNTTKLTSGKAGSIKIAAGKNEIQIKIEPNSNSLAKTYCYTVKRDVALKTMTLQDEENNTIPLGETFNTDTLAYTAKVLAGNKIKLSLAATDTANSMITVNEETVKGEYTIDEGKNEFKIVVKSKDNTIEKTYNLTVTGISSGDTKISGNKGMNLKVWDFNRILQENLIPTDNEDGTVTYTFTGLANGETYRWVAGKYGYNAQSGTFSPTTDEKDNVQITLKETTIPTSSINAQWKNFRNSDENMAVVSADTPITAEETKLKWVQNEASTKFSPGTYLIVDNKIVYTSGTKISLINKDTGKIEKTATMDGSRGYAYMPPVYGGGMIFVSLNGGKIQAFDAKTLESCWVYTDEFGGQALSNLTYDEGYLYTGFYDSRSNVMGNFVCLAVEDENKSSAKEEKYATWTYANLNGFYWSGAYVKDDYIVVGGEKAIFVFNKKTGEIVDKNDSVGDVRCSIAEKDGKLYFTSKNKKLFVAVLSGEGRLTIEKDFDIKGESTSTPVVVGNYAYFGVKVALKDTNITQLDLTNGNIKTVATQAYSQSSLLANIKDENYTYMYFTCNANPGGVECLKLDNTTGEMQLETIFKPEKDKQQFCVASLMCDENGTLYYYNDSGNLFAVEKNVSSAKTYKLSFDIKDTTGKVLKNAKVNILSANGNAALTYNAVEGVYTVKDGIYKYEVSETGYKTLSGKVKIDGADAIIPIVLQKESSSGPITPTEKTVTIQVIGVKGESIYSSQKFDFIEGMTALSLLQGINGISIDWKTSQYGPYVVAINGLGEFDRGNGSGWMYKVNGAFPSLSAGDYKLKTGDEVVWIYTEDLGNDIGGGYSPIEEVKNVTSDTKAGTTTAPTEVKVTEKTNADGTKTKVADVKVSADNQKEILKQAKEKKSNEIILVVSKDAVKDAAKADVTLDKSFIDSIVKDTNAKLTIKTPFGDKTYTQEELKAMSAAATGSTVTVAIEKAAEEPADDAAVKIEKAKSIVKDMQLTARSSKTAKKNVKAVLKSDAKTKAAIKELKDLGFTVKYRFYRSTKKSASYKSAITKKVASYTNTSGKKGTKYFYKVQVRVYDENGKLVAKTALKQCKYASRTWTK